MGKQRGFTLIEMMIAGVIGIFLTASLINLFATTNKSIALSEGLSQNQEVGRFAMDYLTRYIRQAGYTSDFEAYNPPLLMKTDSANCIDNPGLEQCTSIGVDTITCSNGPEKEACSLNDSVDIYGDRLAITSVAEAGSLSCTGTVLADGSQIANVFWVSAEEDTEFELRCRTYDYRNKIWLDSPVSIVNNVESFEFQVGVAANLEDRNSNRYVSLSTVETDSAITLDHIRSIRIAILTSSRDELDDKKLKTDKQERKYSLLDGEVISTNDGNLRNIFSNTIELPNLIEKTSSY
jgi:type IV pilus assembly protein PilW